MSDYYFKLLSGKIERATKWSAAFDLFYQGTMPLTLEHGKVYKIPTGVTTEFHPRLVAIIKEKSGLATKGIEVHGGVIDADYRQEWAVIMTLNDIERGQYTIESGQAIAQFLLIEKPFVEMKVENGTIVTRDEERKGGFGSTSTSKGA